MSTPSNQPFPASSRVPFPQALLLWRQARGLTQATLAKNAGLARPNLSAIESGQRDLTLKTLTLLANALDISPGTLADGHVPPLSGSMTDLTREALERVAASVVSGRPLKNNTEKELADLIAPLVQPRLDSQRARFRQHRGGRRQTRVNWLMLRAHLPKALINNLIERIDEQARSHDAKTH